MPLTRKSLVQIKYCSDRIGGIILLVILLPIMSVIAFLIKMGDRGPVFFFQERAGLGQRIFTLIKFRSMIPNADSLLDSNGSVAISNRVTRIGQILRKFSLDELPQLLNIARGEISFVGPRAVLPEHISKFNDVQKLRFAMKPGLTGLAQINGRNTLKWSKRLEYDVEYVRGYSLALDLLILIRSVKVVLLGEGVVMDRNPEQVDDLGLTRPAST